MIEATAIAAEGRITPGCLGLFDDATEEAIGDRLVRARSQAPVFGGAQVRQR